MEQSPLIVGGSLPDLWHVSHRNLPTVENFYIRQKETVHNLDGGVDTETYGPCHGAWVAAARAYEAILDYSAQSLQMVSDGLTQAIYEYTYVDGDSAKELTEIGEQLKAEIEHQQEQEPSLEEVKIDRMGLEMDTNLTGEQGVEFLENFAENNAGEGK